MEISSPEATAAIRITELSEQVEELQAELTAKEEKLSAQAAELDEYEAKPDNFLKEESSEVSGICTFYGTASHLRIQSATI